MHVHDPLGATLSGRTWGDGGGKTWEHVIRAIRFGERRIDCSCGASIEGSQGAGSGGLERAWNAHRGIHLSETHGRAVVSSSLANDDEVAAFLHRLSGDRGISSPARLPDPTSISSHDDLTEAFAMLEALDGWQARCTCTPRSNILRCRNYIAGDEDLLGDDE